MIGNQLFKSLYWLFIYWATSKLRLILDRPKLAVAAQS